MLKQLTHKRQQNLRELAFFWEQTVRMIEYPTRRFAAFTDFSLIVAYLRGQDVRMGGHPSREKQLNHAMCGGGMIELVVTDERNIWYPTLRRLGFDTLESATAIVEEDSQARRENRDV